MIEILICDNNQIQADYLRRIVPELMTEPCRVTACRSADELRAIYPDITVLALIPDMRLSEKKGYYYSSSYGQSNKDSKKEYK